MLIFLLYEGTFRHTHICQNEIAAVFAYVCVHNEPNNNRKIDNIVVKMMKIC